MLIFQTKHAQKTDPQPDPDDQAKPLNVKMIWFFALASILLKLLL
jgi:hypothetical protein